MDDEYARELTVQAAGRACLALGVRYSRGDAPLDAVADVIRRFIFMIATRARMLAEYGGRASAGTQDILRALESEASLDLDWSHLRDFALAAELTETSQDSPVNTSGESTQPKWNQAFPYEIAPFPAENHGTPLPQMLSTQVDSRSSSTFGGIQATLPQHLPPFPPPHTLKRSAGGGGSGRVKKTRPGHEMEAAEALNSTKLRQKQAEVLRGAKQSLAQIEASVDQSIETAATAPTPTDTSRTQPQP